MAKSKQKPSEPGQKGSEVKDENTPATTDADTAKRDVAHSKETGITMAASTTAEVTATLAPENASNKTVTWSSDDEDYATVTPNANPATVTAVAAGSCTLTVTTDDGGFTDTVSVTVT